MPSREGQGTYVLRATRDSERIWESYYQRDDTGSSQTPRKSSSPCWKQQSCETKTKGQIPKASKCDDQIPEYQKEFGQRREGNESNSAGAMPMEGGPFKITRKDLDTKQRRNTDYSYYQKP